MIHEGQLSRLLALPCVFDSAYQRLGRPHGRQCPIEGVTQLQGDRQQPSHRLPGVGF